MPEIQRETLEFDVLIVGGGPAGLACAIRMAQLMKESGTPLTVGLIEKGARLSQTRFQGFEVLDSYH